MSPEKEYANKYFQCEDIAVGMSAENDITHQYTDEELDKIMTEKAIKMGLKVDHLGRLIQPSINCYGKTISSISLLHKYKKHHKVPQWMKI